MEFDAELTNIQQTIVPPILISQSRDGSNYLAPWQQTSTQTDIFRNIRVTSILI
jgi:hypothetical protein